jgi:hypothetical protein
VSNSVSQAADSGPGKRGRLAAAVAAAVDQIPDVQRSKSLTLSTLYPGGRIDGVVLSAHLVTVHIVIDGTCYGDDLRNIGASAARATTDALRALGDARAVAIRIDDLSTSDALETGST